MHLTHHYAYFKPKPNQVSPASSTKSHCLQIITSSLVSVCRNHNFSKYPSLPSSSCSAPCYSPCHTHHLNHSCHSHPILDVPFREPKPPLLMFLLLHQCQHLLPHLLLCCRPPLLLCLCGWCCSKNDNHIQIKVLYGWCCLKNHNYIQTKV